MDEYVLPASGIVTATEPKRVLSDLLELIQRPAWMADALCQERPEVDFVPDRSRVQWERARETCRSCLVREECLAYALADPTLVGIWGGTDEGERRRDASGGRRRRASRLALRQQGTQRLASYSASATNQATATRTATSDNPKATAATRCR